MPTEEYIQESGRTGAGMAKDSSNKQMERCLLEDTNMEIETE